MAHRDFCVTFIARLIESLYLGEKRMKMSTGPAGHRKRLKERFSKAALEGFHDYEVIELLLTYAIPRMDVKPVAKELVRRFGGLRGVFDAPVEELCTVKGIGENAAVLIALLKELTDAYLSTEPAARKDPVSSPDDVVEFLRSSYEPPRAAEEFVALYMNSKNEILGVETLHRGSLTEMPVSPRKVIEKALKHNARSVIFAHNVAGDAIPTESERKLAAELQGAASSIDIIVHDHLIIGEEDHFSARESGWLKKK